MKPSPLDIIAADLLRGDKCGHAALAAILGLSMREARALMPPKANGLVSEKMHQDALSRAGRKWRDIGAERPSPGCYGLVALRFGDRFDHCIAVYNDAGRIKAFDNNSMAWMNLGVWESVFLPLLRARALGARCWIESVIEVEP